MNIKDYMVILGTAHLGTNAGKQSPDGRLKEAEYSRQIVAEIEDKLLSLGYNVVVDYRPLSEDESMRAVSKTLSQQNRELVYRANFVNALCKKFGKDKVVYVSIHVDAAPPNDGKWHNAGGWSAYTTVGQTKADTLAEHLYNAAEKHLASYAAQMEEGKKTGMYGKNQRPFRTDTSDGDKDMESNFYVLRQTSCPAVLTENLFQDNEVDVKYLLSDIGRTAIINLHVEGIINYLKGL